MTFKTNFGMVDHGIMFSGFLRVNGVGFNLKDCRIEPSGLVYLVFDDPGKFFQINLDHWKKFEQSSEEGGGSGTVIDTGFSYMSVGVLQPDTTGNKLQLKFYNKLLSIV
jgi:hypothetical protein